MALGLSPTYCMLILHFVFKPGAYYTRSSLCKATCIREYLSNMVVDNNKIVASVIIRKWV